MMNAHAPDRRIMPTAARQRGFSLAEVLMALFILGIGIISVASLFPAGIAQQRQSVDDIAGPIIAENALATIRTRVQRDDFGSPDWQEAGFQEPVTRNRGDWDWRRPLYVYGDNAYDSGIEIFSDDFEFEIPYNVSKWEDEVPFRPILQAERYYPQESSAPPQYVWDVMFRRANGRVQAGIFVYQVSVPGGGRARYVVSDDDSIVPREAEAEVDFDDPRFIRVDAAPFEGSNPRWIIDELGHAHRVLSMERDGGYLIFELTRPLPEPPPFDQATMFVYFIPPASAEGEFTFRPIYATVRDL